MGRPRAGATPVAWSPCRASVPGMFEFGAKLFINGVAMPRVAGLRPLATRLPEPGRMSATITCSDFRGLADPLTAKAKADDEVLGMLSPIPRSGAGLSFAQAWARYLNVTTGATWNRAVEVVRGSLPDMLAKSKPAYLPSASLLRRMARLLGTTNHFGEVPGPGIDWAELQWWARRCPDCAWSGEGEFGAWLRIGASERDGW